MFNLNETVSIGIAIAFSLVALHFSTYDLTIVVGHYEVLKIEFMYIVSMSGSLIFLALAIGKMLKDKVVELISDH